MGDFDLTAWVSSWLSDRGESEFDCYSPWVDSMRPLSLSANENLIHAGDSSDRLFLIRRGLLRLFYVTEDGRERNKAFISEGQLCGAISAAITGQPTPFTIQALEECSIIESDRRSFEAVASQHLQASRLQTQLISEAFVRNENREALLLTRDAAGRYEWLLENETDLLARIPQFHIASYLGVDAVSLSRIRRKFKTHGNDAVREE